jgi:Tfp pilus assembly protein PilN
VRAVNLLPKDESRSSSARSRQTLPAIVGAGLLSAVCLGLAFGSLTQSTAANDKRVELAAAKTELSLLPALPRPTAADTSLDDARAKRLGAVSAALGQRVAWDRVLRELSLVLPEDVWLVDLTATSPLAEGAVAPAAGEAAPTQLTLNGRTYSHAGVARLLSRLNVVPSLANVQLQRSSLSQVGSQRIVEFSIVAGIRAPGAAS